MLVLLCALSVARAEEEESEEPEESAPAGSEADLDALLDGPAEPAPVAAPAIGAAARVRVALGELEAIWDRLRRLRQGAAPSAPAVILGEGSYRGRIVRGALQLEIALRAELARPGSWKLVPLVGARAVVRNVSVDGKPVGTAIRRGYHVFATERGGPVTIRLEALVPPGPRGAVEHELTIARTPVTRFECSFPGAGLEPRIEGAALQSLRSSAETTELRAVLAPTTRIRLVGSRALGEAPAEPARVFAEVLSLLSVEERTLELFSVIRYNILYAPVRELTILIPRGVTVVSAEGKGAFRYTLGELPEGTLLRGEAASPLKGSFELSLRLRRERSAREPALEVPLPRCRGVEREAGWLAVEVPGRLRLEERARAELQAIDLRQLPSELVRSAVSPILRAYRYHDPRRSLRLSAEQLPEQETSAEAVDRMRAFSVVSAEGGVLTELRLTLRNRLQRSLSLQLPSGMRLRSALIDGQPVQPSRDRAGAIVVGLSRSLGQERPTPITVQLILEEGRGPLGLAGRARLALPRVSLPASSLQWSVFLPTSNLYTALSGAREPHHGHAPWRDPPEGEAGSSPRGLAAELEPEQVSDGGAMPVRIKLPQVGIRLEHSRHWIGEGQEVSVRVSYLSEDLKLPALVLAGLLAVLASYLAFAGAARGLRRIAALALLALALGPLCKLGGTLAVLLAALAALGAVALRRRWPSRARAALGRWGRTLRERCRSRPLAAPRPRRQRVWRALLGGALLLGALAAIASLGVLALRLGQPGLFY
jgi:hypothetical protein